MVLLKHTYISRFLGNPRIRGKNQTTFDLRNLMLFFQWSHQLFYQCVKRWFFSDWRRKRSGFTFKRHGTAVWMLLLIMHLPLSATVSCTVKILISLSSLASENDQLMLSVLCAWRAVRLKVATCSCLVNANANGISSSDSTAIFAPLLQIEARVNASSSRSNCSCLMHALARRPGETVQFLLRTWIATRNEYTATSCVPAAAK